MKNILFYSPYMGYTGSEIMIKNLISYSNQIRPVILSGNNGALISEIPENIPVYIHANFFIWKYRIGKLAKAFNLPDFSEIQFKKILKKHKIDLIVVNTIVADKIIPHLKKCNIPFVLYSHELPIMYDLIKKEDFNFLVNESSGIIGCSQKVCENYRGLGKNKVYLFYEGIDIKNIKTSYEIEQKIKTDKFSYIFTMSGQRATHKGYHLIIDLALFLKKHNAALVWLGSETNYGLDYYVQKTISKLALDNILLPGLLKKEEYYTWLNISDAFLLTSYVDPYPLVMLEAAYLQKPIIAFDSGGASEFVKEGMGKVVPFYCINSYFKAIEEYIEGKLVIDKNILKSEAERHDISKTTVEFEKLLLEFIH